MFKILAIIIVVISSIIFYSYTNIVLQQVVILALVYATLEDLISNTGSIDIFKYIIKRLKRSINGEGEEFSDEDIEADKMKVKKRRIRKGRLDYEGTTWYKDYVIDANGTYNDPNNRNGRLYRQRFAYDKAQLKFMVVRIEEEGIWKRGVDCCGQLPAPTELILLAIMRMLTRNWTYDDCTEQTHISARTLISFMSAFTEWMSTTVYKEFVKMPELSEVDKNGHEYGLAGLPGTIFSMDCVHIRMWGLFANLKVFFTGKEKFASRVYEVSSSLSLLSLSSSLLSHKVCVNHRRLILNVTV